MISNMEMEDIKDIEVKEKENGAVIDKGPIIDGGGDNGSSPLKVKTKLCEVHVNALPFIPSKDRSTYNVKEDVLPHQTSRNDDLLEPIESVPNGLTIKCNPKIWRSISSDTNKLSPMKPKSLFTLSAVNSFLDCHSDSASLKQSDGQLDSNENLQSVPIRQPCSTPNLLRKSSTDFNVDLPRERGTSVKPSRSDFTNFTSRINEVSAESNYQYENDHRNGLVQSPSRLLLSGRLNNIDFLESPRSFGPIILPNGTIKVRLRNGISVDMTLDKAVCLIDSRSRITISLSCNAGSSVLVHPNGKVHQIGTCVEIVAYDGTKRNNYVRYSKLWHKGISFTSESSALVYLVDSAGTRTTSDTFADMRTDCSISVFLAGSRHGPAYIRDAVSIIGRSSYWCSDDGTEEFHINDFRIIQTADGVVNVVRPSYQWLLRTSFRNCCATLTTPQIHCTASLSESPHLFVRRHDKRVHFDGYSFVVRNASQSAGFDENNLLKLY